LKPMRSTPWLSWRPSSIAAITVTPTRRRSRAVAAGCAASREVASDQSWRSFV
jgi:hypothetical protein